MGATVNLTDDGVELLRLHADAHGVTVEQAAHEALRQLLWPDDSTATDPRGRS